MPTDLADLCFEFHYGCDLADADVLSHLQTTLGRLAPRMSATLEVHAYERDRTRRTVNAVDPDALRAAVVAKGSERGLTFQALAQATAHPDTTGGSGTYYCAAAALAAAASSSASTSTA